MYDHYRLALIEVAQSRTDSRKMDNKEAQAFTLLYKIDYFFVQIGVVHAMT